MMVLHLRNGEVYNEMFKVFNFKLTKITVNNRLSLLPPSSLQPGVVFF